MQLNCSNSVVFLIYIYIFFILSYGRPFAWFDTGTSISLVVSALISLGTVVIMMVWLLQSMPIITEVISSMPGVLDTTLCDKDSQ
jgi:hypothetical protein